MMVPLPPPLSWKPSQWMPPQFGSSMWSISLPEMTVPHDPPVVSMPSAWPPDMWLLLTVIPFGQAVSDRMFTRLCSSDLVNPMNVLLVTRMFAFASVLSLTTTPSVVIALLLIVMFELLPWPAT